MTSAPTTAPKGETVPVKTRSVPSPERGKEESVPEGVTQAPSAGELAVPRVTTTASRRSTQGVRRVMGHPSFRESGKGTITTRYGRRSAERKPIPKRKRITSGGKTYAGAKT